MKARESTMIDCQIDMVWPDTYLEALQRMSREQEQILRDAQSAQPGDLTMLETLCRDIMTYDSASRGREQITHRRYECQHALEDAGNVIKELKTTLEKKAGEFTNEVKQTISKTIAHNGQSERAQEEALQACRAYSAVAQVLQNVPELQSQFQQYYLDLARFSFITEDQLYDSLLSDYCRAQTPEELKAVQKNFQETVLQPFRQTQSLLHEKYSWKYTARILPGWGEYRFIDLALPKRWQELRGEMEIMLRDPEAVISYRQELVQKARELEQLPAELARPELNENYIQALQRAKKALVEPLTPMKSFRYLAEAQQQYEQAQEKVKAVEQNTVIFFSHQLERVMNSEYSSAEEIKQALPTLSKIEVGVTSLENQALRECLQTCQEQLTQAQQGFSRFASVAGIEEHFYKAIQEQGWPEEQEKKTAYALLSGIDHGGKFIPESFWRRMEKLGATNIVEVMARAEKYGVSGTEQQQEQAPI